MKTNKLFGFIVATVIAILAIGTVMAGDLNVNLNQVKANDVVLGSGVTLAGTAGDSLPVQVQFKSNADLQNLRVRVWVEGYSSDVSASTARFDAVNGSTYTKDLSLALPSVSEMNDVNEGLTLYVSISDTNDEVQSSYSMGLQRDTYSLNVLSVDMPSRASAGEIIGLDVVLKNTGARTADDNFVTASIPDLGISKKAYFGDLQPQDNLDENSNAIDSLERRIYLVIPSDAPTGDYTVNVQASDYDTTTSVKRVISITGLAATSATNSTATAVTTPASSGNSEQGFPPHCPCSCSR